MRLQLVQASAEIRQLDEIVRQFTPPMRRVCPHLAESALREMIERMARNQLADERHRCAMPNRRPRTARQRTTRPIGTLHVC
jgi:hypothetical protein